MRVRRHLSILTAALLLSSGVSAQPAEDDVPEEPEVPEAPAAPGAAGGVEPEPAEEEEPVEEEAGEEDFRKKPPAGKGAVWGVVTDTKFREPLIEAPVTVLGTKFRTLTDVDGRFRLELPPGKYTLRVLYDLHRAARFEVTVKAGQVLRADAQLVPDERAEEEAIEVEFDVDRTSVEGQTLARKKAASTGDGIGRSEIARSPDRNAAEAAQRVVGATVIGGRFVYVRGLGERYTNASLNGSPLPSPEPDRATVPLDLFPALVLDSITIAKTFTPDMPGDFAGGSVRIFTRELPRQPLYQVSLGLGYNTVTTFRDRLSYRGSKTDWLGYDGGRRRRPADLPAYRLQRNVARPDGTLVDDAEIVGWARRLNTYMSTTEAWSPPNHSLSVVMGDGFRLGKEQRLGFVASLNYSRSFQRIADEMQRTYGFAYDEDGNRIPGGLQPITDITVERGVDSVRWGAFGNVSYEPAKGHRFSLAGLHSQSADAEARTQEGLNTFRNAVFRYTRLSYVMRTLDFGQLRGEHTLPDLMGAQLDWNLVMARAFRDQPNTRSTLFSINTQGLYAYASSPESGQHFWSEQTENTRGGGLDFTQPLEKRDPGSKLKVGGLVSLRDRTFDARRFSYPLERSQFFTCPPGPWDPTCVDRLFVDQNFGTILGLQENTQPNDKYEAELGVLAGYLMGDVAVGDRLRVVLGQRLERTKLTVDSFDRFVPTTRVGSGIRSTDLLPSLGLIWAVTPSTNLRASVTRTIARPQLREIAPFLFNDYFGSYSTQGNPDLELTRIWNGDLRFEFFPTSREVLAFSLFYKRFQRPIEQVIKPSAESGVLSFQNARGATTLGAEAEARKNLGFLTPALDQFALVSNFTLVRSRVELSPEDSGAATTTTRPLSFQSPFIVNLALDWEAKKSGSKARLLYNVYGRRIFSVGTEGLPDIYEQPRHLLDFTFAQEVGKELELKLTATNLLLSDVVYTQGAAVRPGDANTTNRYSPGQTYTVSATYTY